MSTEQQPFKYAIALTGGIATGKSSVSKIFEEEGFTVIDADRIAHQVLNDAATEVTRLFGREVLQEKGVDRKALGAIVFGDSEKRKALENLLHPMIFDEILRRSQIEDAQTRPYLVDIPLFFETARYNIERVIVTYASRAQQIKRAIQRDGLSREEILRRITAQLDIEEKRKRATYLIDNSGDEIQLHQESRRIIDKIKKDFS
ncbi:dephospho-CoA kinase [Sulfurovum lithotrophicum]|uniref:Dephospho-CoA kinase n=1 Tax=Sulfurovum lithotrophicum TaxID=206403 RepID=A0A7U4M396_9BACT|nr:dephospho-CoA kinase [Sulfurovum lithotrophicum]AKF26060.1 dephospho-CoA kinase [Sulfurovum lithotrophicum]